MFVRPLLACVFFPWLLSAEVATGSLSGFMVGFDASSVVEFETKGVVYKQAGEAKDVFLILKDSGYTHVRLRVWVDPTRDGHSGEAEVRSLAKRAQGADLKILLCFHYSDYWADPKHQAIPPAWRDLSFQELNAALQEHNRRIVAALEEQGTPADMVQLGNEINHGMLWPAGKNEDSVGWGQLAALLKSAASGIRQGTGGNRRMPLMLHVAGNSPEFFQEMGARHVPFDFIGLSYYPRWHGQPENFKDVLSDHARRFKKPVVVVETSYPWTRENPHQSASTEEDSKLPPASMRHQAEFLARVVRLTRSVPDNMGAGVFYWGGERLDGYGNQALFDLEGNALPTLPILAAGVVPPGLSRPSTPLGDR